VNRERYRVDVATIYPSNSQFLKADDLKDVRFMTVTITDWELHTFENRDDGTEKKQIMLTFEEVDKKLGLNKTNAEQIEELIGSGNPDHWLGHSIQLVKSVTKNLQGVKVPCIRINPAYCEGPTAKALHPAIHQPKLEEPEPQEEPLPRSRPKGFQNPAVQAQAPARPQPQPKRSGAAYGTPYSEGPDPDPDQPQAADDDVPF
jgi:hypothetical protein